MSVQTYLVIRNYIFAWVCETENVCAKLSRYSSEGRTPIKIIITGKTPNIMEYLNFEFNDWIYFRSNAGLGEVAIVGSLTLR
jgi:hypothetical protein